MTILTRLGRTGQIGAIAAQHVEQMERVGGIGNARQVATGTKKETIMTFTIMIAEPRIRIPKRSPATEASSAQRTSPASGHIGASGENAKDRIMKRPQIFL